MYVVLHYIGPAENDSKYQYEVTVENDEDTEWVKVTHLARSFTETDDDLLFPKNCLKLHCDHTERFRNEKGELLVLMKILGVGDWLLHEERTKQDYSFTWHIRYLWDTHIYTGFRLEIVISEVSLLMQWTW